jgi:hypothetical protein
MGGILKAQRALAGESDFASTEHQTQADEVSFDFKDLEVKEAFAKT